MDSSLDKLPTIDSNAMGLEGVRSWKNVCGLSVGEVLSAGAGKVAVSDSELSVAENMLPIGTSLGMVIDAAVADCWVDARVSSVLDRLSSSRCFLRSASNNSLASAWNSPVLAAARRFFSSYTAKASGVVVVVLTGFIAEEEIEEAAD